MTNHPAQQHASAAENSAQGLSTHPHTAPASKVLQELRVDRETGLSEEEAAARLVTYGPNRIKPPPKANIWKIVFHQVANAMTVILSMSR